MAEAIPSGATGHDRTLLLLTSMMLLATEGVGTPVPPGWLANCVEALRAN